MNKTALSAALFALLTLFGFKTSASAAAFRDSEALRSPVNQVFQFMYSAPSAVRTNGTTAKGTVYLWVPEKCRKVRAVVIMCSNVPEHMLVGHPAIRQACADNDLALVWGVPTFWSFAKGTQNQEQADYLQQLLAGLAQVSGYDELATMPWLPMGESGHLLLVTGLVDARPEHCIAGICMKNPQYPKDRTVPMLWTLGTAQEWGQKKGDVRLTWKGRNGWGHEARWPLGSLIEPGTGHFYCTDRMAEYFGKYIDAACKARLSDDGSPTLKPVPLDKGYLAWMPSPEDEHPAVTAWAQLPEKDRNRPWFFTEALARDAQEFSRVNWKAETQMLTADKGEHCKVEQFTFQDSIPQVTVTTASEFGFEGRMLETIPTGFVGAGEKLATTPGQPEAVWICGPMAPLGGGKFKVALDRSWPGAACYLVVKKNGTDTVRDSLQPVAVKLQENKEGKPQTIAFDKIPDVTAGTVSVPLSAKSDAGLPVEFFVVSGPAIVKDGKLVFTPIPPRAKFPVAVTVAAWQWGSPDEPKVKMAPIVRQTFQIVKSL